MALDIEQIRADLNRRFAEPLPEFYKRRVIVWKDEEREYAALPEKIEKLESEIADFQAELAKPEVYTDAKRIVELQKELADRESELEKAYERFGELDALGG